MPAAFMWARGLGDRPVIVRFVPPGGSAWRVATQLFPTDDPLTYTAPNLQYFFDSPTELSDFTLRTFRLGSGDQAPTFRIALHHRGTDEEADAYARDAEAIVREAEAVFGELPPYDSGTYTFIADYLPYASGDGMEHRNSTVLTSSGALSSPSGRRGLVDTVAHEFFHGWNVERIRPASLEPFDFEAANVSSELWLAEGFTSYYGTVLTRRAGLTPLESTLATFASFINTVTVSPGRQYRSAAEMSRQAPFVDAARSVDRTNQSNTFISYYTWGAAIGLGLDLALRTHTDGRATLDDYMRAMWETHGRAGGRPGYVYAPYDLDLARARLIEVSGDRAFADDFFARYIEGREVVAYAPLLARAGLIARPRDTGRPWMGNVRLEFGADGARLLEAAPHGSPLFEAGLDQDDLLISLDGERISSVGRLGAVLDRHRPGDSLPVTFARRDGPGQGSITLEADPRLEIVSIESTGADLDEAERAFRDAWLGSRVQ
jgi:predicted metalloprotease with PDZ domain